jgi:hypothetical protein
MATAVINTNLPFGVQKITLDKKVVGFFVPNKKDFRSSIESFLEDLEALSSKNYLKRIASARKEKGGFTLGELKKKYKIS